MTKKITVCMFGTYDRDYTSNKLFLNGLKRIKVPVIEVNAPIPVTRLDRQNDMTWYHLIRRIVQKHKIIGETMRNWSKIRSVDVIYIGYPGHFDVFFAFLVAKLAGKKLVFNPLLVIYTGFSEEQGILNKQSLLGTLIRLAESAAYRLCDLIFADTPFQEEYLSKFLSVPRNKMRVLAIGADDEYYRYTPYRNTSKKINVVYYGLYSPVHGVEHIIEAARMLRNDPDIHFTMVGNGNTYEINHKKAESYKLRNITFYANTPLDFHPAIIEKADIFLGFLQKHPSVDRIIPNKVYQGLALNKVVLTADAPVTRSIFLHRENIFLVNPADPQSLAQALIELKENPKLRKSIAENGYDLFIKNYNPVVVGRKMIQYIQEIL